MKKLTFDITIPKISNEIIDCQITRWFKDIGDYIYEGDVLVELETEKTTIEIESPSEGVLEGIYVFEGEEVIEGERIGIIKSVDDFEDDEEEEFDDEEFFEDDDDQEEELDDEEFEDIIEEEELEDEEDVKKPVYQPDIDDDDFGPN